MQSVGARRLSARSTPTETPWNTAMPCSVSEGLTAWVITAGGGPSAMSSRGGERADAWRQKVATDACNSGPDAESADLDAAS